MGWFTEMQLYNLFECLYRRVYSLGSRRFDALEFENRFKAFWVIRSRWVSCYDYHFPDLNRGWLKSSQHDRGSLCPWFDMCNHSEDPLVRYDYSADNGMVLRAIDDIQARVNDKAGHPSIRDVCVAWIKQYGHGYHYYYYYLFVNTYQDFVQ